MSSGFVHDYPVDPVGHGDDRPDPAWPGGAGLALQVAILAADPLAGRARSSLDPAVFALEQKLDDDRRRGVARRRDAAFGARAGLERLRTLVRRLGIQATWFFAASMAERLNRLVRDLADEGDEIALLGDAAALEGGVAAVSELADRVAAVAGRRPCGWRSLRRHPEGRRLLAGAGMLYDTDAADDDLPYWSVAAGRGFLVLPVTPLGRSWPFDAGGMPAFLLTESATRPQMLRLELDPGLHGRPDQAAALSSILAQLAGRSDVWATTAGAIARHWQDHHPFAWT